MSSEALIQMKNEYQRAVEYAQAQYRTAWQADHPGEDYEQAMAARRERLAVESRARQGIIDARQFEQTQQATTIAAAMTAPPGIGMEEARELLRERIAEHQRASEAVAAATTHEVRARERHDTLAAELDGFADLDEQVTQATVDATKKGTPDDALPYTLVNSVRERARVAERLDAAAKALRRLTAEVAAAKAAEAKANIAVTYAAGVVLTAVADVMASRLVDLEGRATELRRSLASLSAVSLQNATGMQPVSLGVRAKEVLRQQPLVLDAERTRRWQRELEALIRDADHVTSMEA